MILEALAAVKIANEAIGAIKEFAGHVESVGQMGSQLTKLADAKDEIEKKAQAGDMDAFLALEDIHRHETEIKNMFIYSGRPGLWEDYCKFIANRKMLRERAQKRELLKKQRRKRLIKDWAIGIGVTLAALSAIGLFILLLIWIAKS
jgi:hypothetical protein